MENLITLKIAGFFQNIAELSPQKKNAKFDYRINFKISLNYCTCTE